jgi:hypothetical protein
MEGRIAQQHHLPSERIGVLDAETGFFHTATPLAIQYYYKMRRFVKRKVRYEGAFFFRITFFCPNRAS